MSIRRVYEAENNEVVEEESWDFGFGDDDDGFWDDEVKYTDVCTMYRVFFQYCLLSRILRCIL